MRQSSAAVGSAAFFVAAPGTVVGLGPWLITRWRLPDASDYPAPLMALGVVLIVVGLVPPVAAFARFAPTGRPGLDPTRASTIGTRRSVARS